MPQRRECFKNAFVQSVNAVGIINRVRFESDSTELHQLVAALLPPIPVGSGFPNPTQFIGFAAPIPVGSGFPNPIAVRSGFAAPIPVGSGFPNPIAVRSGFAAPM